jgi:hypothetical protein
MLDTLMSLLMGLLAIAFGVFCGVNAISLIYNHIKLWRSAIHSKTWLATDGQVVDAALEATGRGQWKPTITYTYRVSGVEYKSQRLAFDYFGTYFHNEADELMERYAVNSTVKVFYDPEQPQESTLAQIHRGLTGGMLLMPLFLLMPTALCICVGLIGLADIWKK